MSDATPLATLTDPAKPSRWVVCHRCNGTGWIETSIDAGNIGHGYPCRTCDRGYIEVPG